MKKLIILFIAVLNMSSAFAQLGAIKTEKKEKNSAFYLGPKAGVTMTSMTQPDECDLYDKFGIGFSGGLAMKARFGKGTKWSSEGTGFVGVGLELKYKQNNVKTIANDDLKLGYFEVPVMLQLYPFAKSNVMNGFYIELGGSFAGIMSKKPDELTVNNPGGDYTYVTYHTGDLKGFDVRPLAGLGFSIPVGGDRFDINGRYYLGTSELAKNFPCKMNTVEVSLSYYFKLARF